MANFIIMKTETFEPKGKTTWRLVETEEKVITEKHYNNMIDSSPFFRRLGGSERAVKSYTSQGYKTTRLTSMSPDRQIKKVRTFDLDTVNEILRECRYNFGNREKEIYNNLESCERVEAPEGYEVFRFYGTVDNELKSFEAGKIGKEYRITG